MSKSKEKMLDKLMAENLGEYVREDVLELMDEYARQEALGFAEWIDGCGYNRIPYKGKDGEWTEGNEIVAETTEQLFDLYLQSKNKEK